MTFVVSGSGPVGTIDGVRWDVGVAGLGRWGGRTVGMVCGGEEVQGAWAGTVG